MRAACGRTPAAAALVLLLAFGGCSSAGHDGAATPAGAAVRAAQPPAAASADAGPTTPAAVADTENTAMPIEKTLPQVDRVPGAEVTAASGGEAAGGAVPAHLLAAARADLEQRLAAERGTGPIRVLVAEAVTWPDGALGCPKPGVNYTMALVPGYRVVFGVGDGATERRYAYHSGRRGPLAYCATPGAPAGAAPVA